MQGAATRVLLPAYSLSSELAPGRRESPKPPNSISQALPHKQNKTKQNRNANKHTKPQTKIFRDLAPLQVPGKSRFCLPSPNAPRPSTDGFQQPTLYISPQTRLLQILSSLFRLLLCPTKVFYRVDWSPQTLPLPGPRPERKAVVRFGSGGSSRRSWVPSSQGIVKGPQPVSAETDELPKPGRRSGRPSLHDSRC